MYLEAVTLVRYEDKYIARLHMALGNYSHREMTASLVQSYDKTHTASSGDHGA